MQGWLLIALMCVATSVAAHPGCGEVKPSEWGNSGLRGILHPPRSGHLQVRFTVDLDGTVSDLQALQWQWDPPLQQDQAKAMAASLMDVVSKWRYAPRTEACTMTTIVRFKIAATFGRTSAVA